MKAVYKRELAAYFHGFFGSLFIALLLFFTGLYTMSINLNQSYPQFEYVLGSITFLYLVIIPVLTMRSMAEERRQKTDQLLYALPLPSGKIVMGKYLAMVTVLAIPMAVMALYPLVLSLYGAVSLKAAYSALLGFFLLGAALIAIGLFLSSLTENVVISAVLSFAVLLVLYLMGGLSSFIPSSAAASCCAFLLLAAAVALILWLMTKNVTLSAILFAVAGIALLGLYFLAPETLEGSFQHVMEALSVFDRFESFLTGVFDLTAVVYDLSIIGIFCFLTQQTLEKRRWG